MEFPLEAQIRFHEGGFENVVIKDYIEFVGWLCKPSTYKISFSIGDGERLALYSDGSFQLFGGLINYPHREVI